MIPDADLWAEHEQRTAADPALWSIHQRAVAHVMEMVRERRSLGLPDEFSPEETRAQVSEYNATVASCAELTQARIADLQALIASHPGAFVPKGKQ